MASGFDLRLPQPLDCGNLAKEWPQWKQAFGIYLRANNKLTESEENKIAIFLWLIGSRGVEIYNTLYPDNASTENIFGNGARGNGAADHGGENDNVDAGAGRAEAVINENQPELTLTNVIAAFDEYCLPRKNIAMEAFKFNTITQKEKQLFTDFETELRTQLQYCEFKCQQCRTPYAERMLRDRIIIGIQDKKLQLKLLDGRDEPLAKIIETCKVFEAASENKLILDRKPFEVKSVETQPEAEQAKVAAVTRKQCYNCGKPFSQSHRMRCPAVNVKCFSCGGKGHFRKCCRYTPDRGDTNVKQLSKSGMQEKQKSVLMVNWSDAGKCSNVDEAGNACVNFSNKNIDLYRINANNQTGECGARHTKLAVRMCSLNSIQVQM